jgi:hypothetical protein
MFFIVAINIIIPICKTNSILSISSQEVLSQNKMFLIIESIESFGNETIVEEKNKIK